MIKPLALEDIPSAVALHMAAFPEFYLTSLGPGFLGGYYRLVIEHHSGVCLGYYGADGRLQGFAAGFLDPPGFYLALRRRRSALVFAALPSLLANPRRLIRLISNYRRTAVSAAESNQRHIAELSSLAVDRSCGRRGIGSRLVRAFASEVVARGGQSVSLTTDARENERVNQFYAGLGFEIARSFEAQPSRVLNEYVGSAHRIGQTCNTLIPAAKAS